MQACAGAVGLAGGGLRVTLWAVKSRAVGASSLVGTEYSEWSPSLATLRVPVLCSRNGHSCLIFPADLMMCTAIGWVHPVLAKE